MNLIKKTSIVLSLAAMSMVSSCDIDFEEMNTSPNAAVSVPATNIFGAVWPSGYTVAFSTSMTTDYGGAYSGHFGIADYTYRSAINDPIWTACYDVMNTCEDCMEVALEEGNENLYAAALTMKVFYGNKCVNYFGDMPYSEAFRLDEGFIHPNYDSQKDVYLQQLDELATALSMFDVDGEDLGDGDFMHSGDITKWIKFANSLRLRLAIRANSGESGLVDDVFTDIMKYDLIYDNDDNAYWWAAGTVSYYERWYAGSHYLRDDDGYKTGGPRAQETLVDLLQSINDPRIKSFMETNKEGIYNGYYMGAEQDSNVANSNAADSLSGVGDYWCLDPAGFTPLLNASEVYLCLAEAALLGKISGDAQTYYETAIKTSLSELKYYTYPSGAIKSQTNGTLTSFTDDEISAYLAEPEVAWGSGTTYSENIDKIALQKWIVFYKQGPEAWTENRRTDVPAVTAVNTDFCAMHNRPPFRFPYSTDDAGTNENFPTDVNEVDIWYGDQLWWDKREGVY